MFPYHYGSHATDQPVALRSRFCVSIPLWFSRNTHITLTYTIRPYCFHTTMVLTQRQAQPAALRSRFCVSIPLWFSRNSPNQAIPHHLLSSFHTTMVLTQLIRFFYILQAIPKRFHTTMVLTQLTPCLLPTSSLPQFPYHYGSHATWHSKRPAQWFICFHTTMVLTQHESRSH